MSWTETPKTNALLIYIYGGRKQVLSRYQLEPNEQKGCHAVEGILCNEAGSDGQQMSVPASNANAHLPISVEVLATGSRGWGLGGQQFFSQGKRRSSSTSSSIGNSGSSSSRREAKEEEEEELQTL